jgi:hypothetical protein
MIMSIMRILEFCIYICIYEKLNIKFANATLVNSNDIVNINNIYTLFQH